MLAPRSQTSAVAFHVSLSPNADICSETSIATCTHNNKDIPLYKQLLVPNFHNGAKKPKPYIVFLGYTPQSVHTTLLHHTIKV